MRNRKATTEVDPDAGNRVETTSPGLPVVLLATRSLSQESLDMSPELQMLSRRFDLLLVKSPARVLNLSRGLRSRGSHVVLLLSDMLSCGAEIIHFASAFSEDWPDASFHLLDAMEGRVIFSEPNDPQSGRGPTIRIESNGRELLSAGLVLKMVERYNPEYVGKQSTD